MDDDKLRKHIKGILKNEFKHLELEQRKDLYQQSTEDEELKFTDTDMLTGILTGIHFAKKWTEEDSWLDAGEEGLGYAIFAIMDELRGMLDEDGDLFDEDDAQWN